MEMCRYCGHAGAHAPDCPTQKKRESWRVDDRESPVAGVTVLEMHRLVGIRDSEHLLTAEELDKVTRENMAGLIDAEFRRTAEHRRSVNARELPGLLPTALVDLMYERNSSSHAFQCSVNKAEDFGAYLDHLRARGTDAGVPEDDPDLRTLVGYAHRQETMNDLMSRLFEKDVARRIGRMKGDDGFFQDAMRDWPALADELLASLDEFDAGTNKARIDANADIRQQLDGLRRRIEASKAAAPESLDAAFYGDVCMAYSILIFEDCEVLNEDAVRDAAANLERKAAGG